MNKRVILYIIGWVLIIEGALMQLSTIVGLYYKEAEFRYFIYVGVASAVLGLIIVLFKPKKMTMYTKEGFASTALSWIVLSLVGALPFFLSGAIPSYLDAFFEAASGFTTTGATILKEIEGLPYCILFWRSFTHMLGGMGVIVFLLALVPRLGGNQSINLMRAESTGTNVSKSMPKLTTYAKWLYGIYCGLTFIEFVLLKIAGMGFFDSITTAFSCAGTGGFMVYNDSVASFSPIIQTICAVFMMLFGINFYVYILILTGKIKQAFKNEELWTYLGIVVVSTVAIAINMYTKLDSIYGAAKLTFREAIHRSFFYVTSIISTTGQAIENVNLWPLFSISIIVIITCIGACGGSTGGGIKVARIQLLFKDMRREFASLVHPRTVQTIKVDNKKVSSETVRTVTVFMSIYMSIVIISTILVSLDPVDGMDFTTAFSGTLATINNTGPGLGLVGSTGNYADLSIFTKLIFCFNMIAGRLELYPLILLFSPRAWRRN